MPLNPLNEAEEDENEDGLSWLQFHWKHRLHFQAMTPAFFVYIAGGMKVAWSLFETPSGKFLSNFSTLMLTIAWFVGVIIGSILATTFVQRWSKSVAQFISGGLLLCGGIGFVSLPKYFLPLFFSCVCEGCAYGLTQVQAFVTGGELAHRNIRGLLLSTERIFLWFGICLQILYTWLWYSLEPKQGHVMYIDQIHGIIVASMGILAIISSLINRMESPLLVQMQRHDVDRPHIFKRLLSRSSQQTEDSVVMREDCKQIISYDCGMTSWDAFRHRNLQTLIKIIVLRSYAALSLSLPTNRVFLTVSEIGFGCVGNCIYLLALCGLLGSLVGGLLIDFYGRRILSVAFTLSAGIFIFITGGIFQSSENPEQVFFTFYLEMMASLMMVYMFLTSAGIAVATTAYIAEAFTVQVKSKCISAVLISEQLTQIIMIIIVYSLDFNEATYFFTIGSLGLIFGLLMFFLMPETANLSLYECLLKFRKCS